MFKESAQDLSKKTFYHGSELKVDEFKIRPPSPEHPIYITTNRSYADSYAGGVGGTYIIKMSSNANVFDPSNPSDIAKAKKSLPKLIRIIWLGEDLKKRYLDLPMKDLMNVSSELTPMSDSTYGDADDSRLEDDGIVAKLISLKILNFDQAEEAIEELDEWLDRFGFTYDSIQGYFNQVRTIVLKVLSKLGYQAYFGKEDDGSTPTAAVIYGVFSIDAIAEISAKPIGEK